MFKVIRDAPEPHHTWVWLVLFWEDEEHTREVAYFENETLARECAAHLNTLVALRREGDAA